jgi:galactokinase
MNSSTANMPRAVPRASGRPPRSGSRPYATPRSSICPDWTVSEKRRARHVVTEDQRVLDTVALLRAGKVRDIGPLLTASHESLRHDFEVTVPRLDVAVEAALAAGAYGARMTGGGFGGCVLALVDAGTVSTVDGAVREAFARRGFGAPESFVAIPGPGASRIG